MTSGTAPFGIRIAARATDYLARLDGRTRDRIWARLGQIAVDPYGQQTKPLTNVRDQRSARVGDFRIIFSVDVEERVINVGRIGPRGQIYRGL